MSRAPRSRETLFGRAGLTTVTVGAATLLIGLITVFVSYNAGSGLPFVKTYDLKAELPNAQNLIPGNEVRFGGVRVGQVLGVKAVAKGDRNIAVADLQLDADTKLIPKDSSLLVRSRSTIGLKYLEILPGNSQENFKSGETIPVSNARVTPVDLDEALSTFDDKTRASAGQAITSIGDALAGRGSSLNDAIASAGPLFEDLPSVMRNIRSANTDLSGWIRSFSRLATEFGAVSAETETLIKQGEATFSALAEVSRSGIQRSLEESPAMQQEVINSGQKITSLLAATSEFAGALKPAITNLGAAAPTTEQALASGTKVAAKLDTFTDGINPVREALNKMVADNRTLWGLKRTAESTDHFGVLLRPMRQMQLTCHALSTFWKNGARVINAGDRWGNWQGSELMLRGGEGVRAQSSGKPWEKLHLNPYPNAGQDGSPQECENGVEPWNPELRVGNAPGTQPRYLDFSPNLTSVDMRVVK